MSSDKNCWERPYEPFEHVNGDPYVKHVPNADSEVDKKMGPKTLRILTINMNGRPMDVLRAPKQVEPTVVGGLFKLFGHLNVQIPAGPYLDKIREPTSNVHVSHETCHFEYHLNNAQDTRMYGFFEWLDKLASHERPQVICFQEIIWNTMIDIAHIELTKRGYTTHDAISLENDRGSVTKFPPRMGSGLGIYVLESEGLHVVSADRCVFDTRLGADWICEKGFKWALVRIRNKALLSNIKANDNKRVSNIKANTLSGEAYCLVLTTHPQAYNELGKESPHGESWVTRLLRSAARLDFQVRGGLPSAVTKAHRLQYKQMAEYINTTLVQRVRLITSRICGLFVAGDYNVNRYAAGPDTKEEQNPQLAATRSLSREFAAVMATLNCPRLPIILQEPNPRLQVGNGGRFTWDGSLNPMAAPLATDSGKPSFSWIDSVLACQINTTIGKGLTVTLPRYMDNRSVRLALSRPVPEVAPFWSSRCVQWRYKHSSENNNAINTEVKQRIQLGIQQLEWVKQKYNQLQLQTSKVPSITFKQFILQAPYRHSSQLWKGLDYYGMKYVSIDVEREIAHLHIGQPHPYRMLTDVSDHHGVLARIVLT